MKNLSLFFYLPLIVILFHSCKEEKDSNLYDPIFGLGGVQHAQTELDKQIYELYTKPYNIDVMYRWDAGEMSYTTVLVPADESRVLPVMNILKQGWIEPFTEVVGEMFVKTYIPKQYVLIGSYAYASNGNIILGSADQGLKINIYGVNQIDLNNDSHISRILGTVHHELAHVLHQNKMYPADFELVSAGDYQSSWSSVSTADARRMGFASSYGSSSPNEDFATLLATLLGNGEESFDELLAGIDNAEGVRRLREKESIMITYFKQSWNIDFRELQAATSAAKQRLLNP